MTAAVAGASGYAGGELLRLLLAHPMLSVGAVAAAASTGRRLADVHPNLVDLADRELIATDPATLAAHEVVFLALPHGESATIAGRLPPDVPVVDLGADHRLADPEAWETFYGTDHSGSWVYGLPELSGQRSTIAGHRRIANPGCYPTAVSLGAAPLLAAGLTEPRDVVVVATSGTSGAGRGASPTLLGSEVMGSVSAYKAGGAHQHTPEIEQTLSDAAAVPVTVSFTPLLAPMPRGILATTTLRLAEGVTTELLREALHAAYATEPFVHLLADHRWPRTADVAGSNAVHLQVAADRHAGRAVVVSAIDNLGKGAAGQALQNANLMLGFPEVTGLTGQGVAP